MRMRVVLFALMLGLWSQSLVHADSDLPLRAEIPEISHINPLPASDNDWLALLKAKKLNINNPEVVWPKGTGWIFKTYNAINRFVNSPDTNYISGTGYHLKVYVQSNNWTDSYSLTLDNLMSMTLVSDLTSRLNFRVNAYGISFGYGLDMSKIIANRRQKNKHWDFTIDTELFSLYLYRDENNGGSVIRRYGQFNRGMPIRFDLPGVEMKSQGVDFMAFVNPRRYSQAAAYSYSKIQRKSTGSFLAGLTYNWQKMKFDLTTLPPLLRPYLKLHPRTYRFFYSSYCLAAGYTYSWVFGRGFLFNLQGLPSIGWNNCHEGSVEGDINLLSLNIKASAAFVYNFKNLFMGVTGAFNEHWYISDRHRVSNSIMTFSGEIGVRF